MTNWSSKYCYLIVNFIVLGNLSRGMVYEVTNAQEMVILLLLTVSTFFLRHLHLRARGGDGLQNPARRDVRHTDQLGNYNIQTRRAVSVSETRFPLFSILRLCPSALV